MSPKNTKKGSGFVWRPSVQGMVSEAEPRGAVVRVSCETVGVQMLRQDMGRESDARDLTEAAASNIIIERGGLGEVRHIHVTFFATTCGQKKPALTQDTRGIMHCNRLGDEGDPQ